MKSVYSAVRTGSLNKAVSDSSVQCCYWHYVHVYFLPVSLLNPTGHMMLHQFNIQQLYALPTLYSYVLYLSGNKERLVPLTA